MRPGYRVYTVCPDDGLRFDNGLGGQSVAVRLR